MTRDVFESLSIIAVNLLQIIDIVKGKLFRNLGLFRYRV